MRKKNQRSSKSGRTPTNSEAEAKPAQPQPQTPTPEQIRKRAQEIFEARGGAPGHELDDWLQAETELKTELVRRPENLAGPGHGLTALA